MELNMPGIIYQSFAASYYTTAVKPSTMKFIEISNDQKEEIGYHLELIFGVSFHLCNFDA